MQTETLDVDMFAVVLRTPLEPVVTVKGGRPMLFCTRRQAQDQADAEPREAKVVKVAVHIEFPPPTVKK